jgi:hypothetical protein
MEGQIDATGSVESGAGVIAAGVPSAPSTTIDTSSAQTGQIAGGATAGDVQGQSATTQEADPFAGVPSLDELSKLAEQNVPNAKSLIQLRTALEARNAQYSELEPKFRAVEPFQQHLERFEKPEQLQEIVDFREKLYGWENDPQTGQLIPSTQSLVQQLTETAPERADFLSADLLNGMTRDPETGRQMTRLDLALEAIAQDPGRKAKALSILGGVEPTSIAPTWQPTAEELQVVKPELQDVYKKLPYDKREALKLNDPEFINEYLEDQKFKIDTREREAAREQRDRQVAQQREQYIQREAENAGNQLVEQQFKEGFSGFAQNICEKFQPIKPLDPNSPEAQQMGPDQVAQTNAQIQKVNRGAGMIVSLVAAASAVPDVAFLIKEIAADLGLPADVLQKMDAARVEFASNNRNFANLRFRAGVGQNGNIPQDIQTLQSNAQRAQRALTVNAKAVAEPLMSLLSDLFSLQAQSHNSTLNGAATARAAITGNSYDPTQVAQRPPATSEAEIRQRMREGAQAIASR